jgi:hypothetical protein
MYRDAARFLEVSQGQGRTFDLSIYLVVNWMQFVIGIPAGFLFFAITYPLLDILPIGGVSLWSVWDVLGPAASVGRLFNVIDACHLNGEITHRVMFLKHVSYAFAWFAGRCIWRSVVAGRAMIDGAIQPVERLLLAFLLCVGVCVYALQGAFNSHSAAACIRWFSAIL